MSDQIYIGFLLGEDGRIKSTSPLRVSKDFNEVRTKLVVTLDDDEYEKRVGSKPIHLQERGLWIFPGGRDSDGQALYLESRIQEVNLITGDPEEEKVEEKKFCKYPVGRHGDYGCENEATIGDYCEGHA